MTKHVHIILWIPLLYAVLFFIFWIRIYQNENIAFEKYVLERQSNYATDSAISELLVASNLNQDYADGDFITLEPTLATRDFSHTFCVNFGYIPTEDNMKRVLDENVKTMVICVYDGIYAFYPMDTETHGYELSQSPKIPYFYTSDSGQQFALTLGLDKGYWDYMSGSNYKLNKYDTIPADIRPSKDRQLTAINNQVADVVNWALYESYDAGRSEKQISLPAIANTVKGEQPVDRPTIISVVEGREHSFASAATAETIGGSALEDTDHLIGLKLTNAVIGGERLTGKFYAYESWWKKHPQIVLQYAAGGTLDDGKYFDSVYDAAKEGYNDLNLMD